MNTDDSKMRGGLLSIPILINIGSSACNLYEIFIKDDETTNKKKKINMKK
jgi:hypothetical protein